MRVAQGLFSRNDGRMPPQEVLLMNRRMNKAGRIIAAFAAALQVLMQP